MPLGKMDIGTQRNDSLPRNRLERPDEATLEMACAGVSSNTSRPPTLTGKCYMLTVIPVLYRWLVECTGATGTGIFSYEERVGK